MVALYTKTVKKRGVVIGKRTVKARKATPPKPRKKK